ETQIFYHFLKIPDPVPERCSGRIKWWWFHICQIMSWLWSEIRSDMVVVALYPVAVVVVNMS
nr:hypothetical protein [Tanacetum cinerariifolium]